MVLRISELELSIQKPIEKSRFTSASAFLRRGIQFAENRQPFGCGDCSFESGKDVQFPTFHVDLQDVDLRNVDLGHEIVTHRQFGDDRIELAALLIKNMRRRIFLFE